MNKSWEKTKVFFVLGLSVVLAAMLVVSGLASLFVTLLWRVLSTNAHRWSAATRANMLCVLRILPVAVGLGSIVILFGPAYLAYEPRTNHEDVGAKLAIVALLSALGIAVAVIRGVVRWRVTSRLTADWLKKSRQINFPGIRIRSYCMEHEFPVIAVFGIFRPRVFIANRILQSLTNEELLAALEHESGHILARDNLKSALMRACQDVLFIVPWGRQLDGAWKEASEAAADEHASRRGSGDALDLASALMKIARMIPAGAKVAMPAGALLVNHDEEGSVSERVRRLSRFVDAPVRKSTSLARSPLWIACGLVVLTLGLTLNGSDVLPSVHTLIEHGVRILD